MKQYEFHEAANIFPLDEEHLDDLANDIRRNGQQVAIELFDGVILDGRRRYLACKQANILPRFIEVDVVDPIAYVLSLNLHRRHLSPTQLSMVGARAMGVYEKQAKERQKEAGKVHGRGMEKVPVNLPEPISGDARDQAAKAVGVSGKSIDYGVQVLESKNPALIDAVDSDLLAVSTAAKASLKSDVEVDALIARAAQAKAAGKRRARPTAADKDDEIPVSNGEVRGVGVIRANEAINSLSRIPKNDALRKRGFQIVTDWIRHNK